MNAIFFAKPQHDTQITSSPTFPWDKMGEDGRTQGEHEAFYPFSSLIPVLDRFVKFVNCS